MYERKHTVQVARARRRVKALEQANAPYPFRARAMKQLWRVEGTKERKHARMD